MSVDELRDAFSPNTAVPLFGDTPSGVANPTVELLAVERRDALIGAWVAAVRADPQGWLAHRWTVFRRLFGAHRNGDLRYMVDSPEFLAGSAPEGMRGAWHGAFRRIIEAGKRYGLFSPAPSLLISLGLFAFARRREAGMAPSLQWALLASAMVYLLALFPLTPSAEQRYLAWPMFACVLAAALALARAAQAESARSALSR
jgi:hypothetical protein